MSQVITPHKTGRGWIVELPPELAAELNVEPGAVAILYPKDGALETEILPAPSDELKEDFERLFEKHRDTLAELKRLGD
jgi:hypothetical protein